MAEKTFILGSATAASRKRIGIALLAFSLAAVYLLATIFRLQVFQYDYYRNKVLDQITTTSKINATRGAIYDSSMNLLAYEQNVWRIFVTPVDIREAKEADGKPYDEIIARGLSELLDLSYDDVYKKVCDTKHLDQTILKKADASQYQSVLAFVTGNNLSDLVHTEAYTERYYPMGELACHVLGFTGSDNQGLFGLEYTYDSVLKGTDGYYLYAKDANGIEMPNEYASFVNATDGNSIVTTIDSYIQAQLEYQLNVTKETYGAKNRVTGIVMNVNTGAILAMATTDGFDCNEPYTLSDLFEAELLASGTDPDSEAYKKLRTELLYEMWNNKAVSELYEPGSTFKIITAATAIETGAVTDNDRFSCTGSLAVGGYRISCHKRTGHGSNFTFAYGLQQSCNPTMIQVASRIGAEKFYQYVEAFGYLQKTGIDLPSEATSIFHQPDALGVTELATASFGQRFKVTVLSQLTAIAAVANGGYLVTPYLVERIIDAEGNTVSEHETEIKRQVISESTARKVASILEEGVSGDGGAKNAAVPGYLIAAKTGTSEKFDILDENGNSYLRVGSCVAFAPSDQPEIAAIIVVDEPSTGKYGSIVAAPYIGDLMASVLPYLGYEPSGETAPAQTEIPDLRTMSPQKAKSTLSELGFTCEIVGSGSSVLSQSPSPGTTLTVGQGKVILYTDTQLSDTVSMPDLIGMNIEEANAKLISCGLNIHLTGANSPHIGTGAIVYAQSVPKGQVVARGSLITVTVLYDDDQD